RLPERRRPPPLPLDRGGRRAACCEAGTRHLDGEFLVDGTKDRGGRRPADRAGGLRPSRAPTSSGAGGHHRSPSGGAAGAADLDIQQITYWIRVATSSHTMTVGNGSDLVTKEPVAVGTGGTPTPQGSFYLMELVRPLGQPYYGPFAYATSAHSDVLQSFMGGE